MKDLKGFIKAYEEAIKAANVVIAMKELIDENERLKRELKKDKHVQSVINKYKERSNEGIRKYGTTLEREDLSFLEWLNHLQEELMDATLYIERLKNENNDT